MKKALFTAFILSFIISGCGKSDSTGESTQGRPGGGGWAAGGSAGGARITSVETKQVVFASIAEQVKSYGTVKAQDVVSVAPQVSNRITRIYVDLGDSVRQGQLLAKIYDATFRDQLSQAKSQLEQSAIALRRDSSQFERQKLLLAKDLISASEYDIAFATYRSSLAQYQTSKASLTQAQESFNNTEVRSPVLGVVTARNFEEGDIATTGQAIFEIASTTGYETRIYLPVQDWKVVKIGQKVNLRVTNEKSSSAIGVVSRKSPQLDPTTGLGEVVVTLTNIGGSIYPGVLTESTIDILNKPRAIVVERSALVEKVETVVEPESNTIQLDRSYSVFVSVGDSTVELRKLTLGIEQGDKIEIVGGLGPGEAIVVTGQQSLEDGGKIRVASGSDFSSPEGQQVRGSGNGGWAQSSGEAGNSRPARPGTENMSDEDRAKLRERMQNMTPEQRQTYRDSVRTANSGSN